MNIPSINQCLALMDRYEMLANIREHSFIVARVAETIVKALQKDRNDRFQRYWECGPSAYVTDLLEEIDNDPTCIFWG